MDKIIKDKTMDSKRTEKLASAIYLITSFFDNQEPMRWRLRELAGRLVSQRDATGAVSEAMGLLSVARNAGLISDTNFQIMQRELGFASPVQSLGDIFASNEALPTVEKTESRPIYIGSSVERSPAPIKDKTSSRPVAEPVHKEPGSVAIKKNNRQTVILSLLRKKGEIMIKDVAPLIDGVSEKTIQRELLAMVSAGILRKIGEKRWSRYTLAE